MTEMFAVLMLIHIILGHKSNLKNALLGLHDRTELWKWRSIFCL